MPNPSWDRYVLSKNSDFRAQVQTILIKVALAVVGESLTGKSPEFINKRHNLGVGILNSPESYVDRFSQAIVAPGTLTISSTDNDIEFMITSVFSKIAGVNYTEFQPVATVLNTTLQVKS